MQGISVINLYKQIVNSPTPDINGYLNYSFTMASIEQFLLVSELETIICIVGECDFQNVLSKIRKSKAEIDYMIIIDIENQNRSN